jgi:hypothetical protein
VVAINLVAQMATIPPEMGADTFKINFCSKKNAEKNMAYP